MRERGRQQRHCDRENAEREGDVGRHRDTPPPGGAGRGVDRREQQRRDDHAADRRGHGSEARIAGERGECGVDVVQRMPGFVDCKLLRQPQTAVGIEGPGLEKESHLVAGFQEPLVLRMPLIVGGAAGLDTASKALLVACGLFVSGVSTLLQTLGVRGFGAQLPLVQGTSFAAVSTILAIIGDRAGVGLQSAYGAVIVASAIGLLITPFFARIVRFFPAVVTGSIITVIGLSLMPVAASAPEITNTAATMIAGSLAKPDKACLLSSTPVSTSASRISMAVTSTRSFSLMNRYSPPARTRPKASCEKTWGSIAIACIVPARTDARAHPRPCAHALYAAIA